jgi:hypothetical protein
MKKICVMLAVALIVSSAVWAQAPTSPSAAMADAMKGLVFTDLSAVKTQSTAYRFSTGTFDNDVDNYIDPTAFDGQIGNFVFAGGFPKTEGGYVTDTDVLTDYNQDGKDVISFGFGKTLGEKAYLALYYGGSFVNASGKKTLGDPDNDDDPDITESEATWRNNLAVLFGIGNMGFTFDLIMNDTTDNTTKTSGKVSEQTIDHAATVALGWGMSTEKIAPWVKLGIKFPDTKITTDESGTVEDGKVDKKVTESSGAIFGLNAGAWLGLNDTSSILADLTIGALFPASVKGDVEDLGFGDEPYTTGGGFGVDMYVKYTKELTFGENTTVKLKPNMDLAFVTLSGKDSRSDDKMPSASWFTLKPGIDVGVEYRYDKIALYTGLGLTFFEWTAFGISGGEDEDKAGRETDWTFTGLAWDSTRVGGADGRLGFGLTFNPIAGLVFGTGVSVGIFNPTTMKVGGTYPSTTGYTTTGANFWNSTVIDITVSYKFASKPREPRAPKEPKEAAK